MRKVEGKALHLGKPIFLSASPFFLLESSFTFLEASTLKGCVKIIFLIFEEKMDLRFKAPFSWLLAGGSGCGKTTKCVNFLKSHDKLIDTGKCDNIIYFYNQWQPSYDELESSMDIQWIEGVPTMNRIRELTLSHKNSGGSIVIIDDFMSSLDKSLIELFTVYAHHGNCSTIFLSQNLFDKNPHFRTVSLNSTYISIFKNPRDKLQISAFARQINPTNSKFVIDSYQAATAAAYSYLFFDNHQKTDDNFRLRSRILPHEQPMIIWMPKT